MDDGDRDTEKSGQQRFWPWLLVAALALTIIMLPLIVAF